MRHIRDRKYGYRAAAVLAAITMAGTMPLTSFAASCHSGSIGNCRDHSHDRLRHPGKQAG